MNPLPYKQEYVILDGVKGRGHYVGTYMLWGVNNNGWWGEGEIKFYLDGALSQASYGGRAGDYLTGNGKTELCRAIFSDVKIPSIATLQNSDYDLRLF